MDLTEKAHRPQMGAKLGAAHRHADAVAALGERTHHMAAEKARAAEHGDESFKLFRSHAPWGAGNLSESRFSPPCIGGGRTGRSIDKGTTAPVPIAALPRWRNW